LETGKSDALVAGDTSVSGIADVAENLNTTESAEGTVSYCISEP